MNAVITHSTAVFLSAWLVAGWIPAQAEPLRVIDERELPEIATDASGRVSYDASTGRFTTTTSSFVARFTEGVNTFWDFGAPRSIQLDLVVATASCAPNASGPSSCDTLPGPGLAGNGANLRVIGTIPTKGYSGVLLEGEIVAMGFADGIVDAFDFRFRVTGGAMQLLFMGKDIGMRFTTEGSSFVGSFAQSFSGTSIKGQIFAIPQLGGNTGSSLGAVGDRVFEDLNGDGVQNCADSNGNGVLGDAGDLGAECDAGIGNVAVELFAAGDAVCGNADDTSLATTLTDAAGFYGFGNLPAGGYCVQVTRPDAICSFGGAAFTDRDIGTDDALDSDVDTAGLSGLISLTAGGTDLDTDAGVVCRARIGDLLFTDTNGDGSQQDADQNPEPGIDGTLGTPAPDDDLVVSLYACDADGNRGALVDTTTIDAAGNYAFDVLPGRYEVVFTAPAGTSFTLADFPLSGDAADSDANLSGATGCIIEVGSNDENLTVDAGVLVPEPEPLLFSRFGNLLFHDKNRNGIQDGGESGIDGTLYPATVEVYRDCGTANEQLVGTYDIDAAGEYLTDDLLAGDYCARFTPPVGFCVDDATGIDHGAARFTLQDIYDGLADPEARDSDVDPATGFTATFFLPEDTTDLRRDAGVYCDALIGDRLWDDTADIDGLQGADTIAEPGIAGAEVTLYECVDGMPDTASGMTIQTDADGFYEFFAAPGTYAVGFSMPSDLAALGYVFSLANQGTDDGFDSDADRNTGISACFTVASKDAELGLDAGVFEPNASLGDTCFHDLNANGIQDQDEPGVDGCRVELFASAGGVCAATEADLVSDLSTAGGLYLFENMQGGDYCLKFSAPEDFCAIGDARFSPRDQGGDDGRDSDVDASGLAGPIAIGYNDEDLTWDAGLHCGARLGDRVFEDANRNDVQDCADADMDGIRGETNGQDTGAECAAGVDDVLVKLLTPGADGQCNTADDGDTGLSQLTADGGFYLFETDPGSYCIEIDPPVGYACIDAGIGEDSGDSDVVEAVSGGVSCRTDATIVLPSDTDDRTWDAGIVIPAAPGIDIEKATNGHDADLPGTGPALTIGDAVTWTYVVTNTGNVDLVNAVVGDDVEGPVCTIDHLAAGEARACELTGTATAADYVNTAAVTARPAYDPDGPAVGDSDPSRYTASEPEVCVVPHVDGGIGDWDLAADFFARLHEAGNPSKDHLADAYVRYSDGTLYVLVLATDGNSVSRSAHDAWVKVYDLGSSTQVDGNSAGFEWVTIDGELRGYEASFALAPGSYDKVEIHLNVNGGDTASTGKKQQGYIPLDAVQQCPAAESGAGADGASTDTTESAAADVADRDAGKATTGLEDTGKGQGKAKGRGKGKGRKRQ